MRKELIKTLIKVGNKSKYLKMVGDDGIQRYVDTLDWLQQLDPTSPIVSINNLTVDVSTYKVTNAMETLINLGHVVLNKQFSGHQFLNDITKSGGGDVLSPAEFNHNTGLLFDGSDFTTKNLTLRSTFYGNLSIIIQGERYQYFNDAASIAPELIYLSGTELPLYNVTSYDVSVIADPIKGGSTYDILIN